MSIYQKFGMYCFLLIGIRKRGKYSGEETENKIDNPSVP